MHGALAPGINRRSPSRRKCEPWPRSRVARFRCLLFFPSPRTLNPQSRQARSHCRYLASLCAFSLLAVPSISMSTSCRPPLIRVLTRGITDLSPGRCPLRMQSSRSRPKASESKPLGAQSQCRPLLGSSKTNSSNKVTTRAATPC